ncbi:MAG: ATP-binding protein [Methanomassiliicoccaceae archaeon]|jgi:AAA15 family ATPase/GTPase|nr:ATP-binding protein [Methanomassiliicoccaceae archaeon]
MLLEFTVENFKSFRDRTTFSMEATADKKHTDNVIEVKDKKLRLLRTSMIYGANASGKTNLIEAMHLFRTFVALSQTHVSGAKLTHTPFIFEESCSKKPTAMELKFLKNDVVYEYAFSYDPDRIISESLVYYPNGRKAVVFERTGQTFTFTKNKRRQGQDAERVNEAALYLSVSAAFNYEISRTVVEWMTKKLMVFAGADPLWSINILLKTINEDVLFKKRVLNAFRIADLGITGIKDRNAKNTNKDAKYMLSVPTVQSLLPDIWVRHSFKDTFGRKTEKELRLNQESSGTVQFISIIGPIISTLTEGGTIVVDEMDVNFHPELCKWIVNLFHDPSENPKGAQLIFNTHDLELQDQDLVRRDQIWFVEKDWETRISSLFSLTEFKERNDRDIRKAYISGRYGAKPFISPDALIE